MKSANISAPSPVSNAPESLYNLFIKWAGVPPLSAVRLLGAGSDRNYWRLSADSLSAVGVTTDDTREAKAFVTLARIFRKNGISVPQVYAESADFTSCLQEDLGPIDLFSRLNDENVMPLLEECMRSLARMQTVRSLEWESAVAFPPMSRRLVFWDLNYFKYEYLKPSAVSFSEEALEDDFERLADCILSIPGHRTGFMMRDCQSRNVMIHDGVPYWIDFQGGRRGPALYDAVSFVYQAKAGFSEEVRAHLLDVYSDSFCKIKGVKKDDFLSDLPVLRLFRCLQVLGAYGFRGLVQRRAHFIESIPMALANLAQLEKEGALDAFPELHGIALALIKDNRFKQKDYSGLRVSVFSFSYKKGYPDDFSGNGGGFMFDCRAMHNPGRYKEYKSLTGLDQPVIEFLEKKGEVEVFLDKAEALVLQAVERYLKRGFSSLQVGFGCTGGQHRSVFCARRMAERLVRAFPQIEVAEIHRERDLSFLRKGDLINMEGIEGKEGNR